MSARLLSACLTLAVGLPLFGGPERPRKDPPDGPLPAGLVLGKGDRVIARHGGGVSGLCFSPDGKQLATTGGDHVIRLWELTTGKEVRRFEGLEQFIRTVAFSPDGKLLASAGDDPGVVLWDVATGKQVRRIGKHDNGLRLAAFSPDGKTLVSSGFDEHIGLWDVATGKQLHFFRAHPRVPYGVAFSPDGKTLVSGGDREGTIRLWDVATGKEIRSWDGQAACIFSVAFSPDGRLVASTGDGVVRLWEAATGKEVRRLEGHKGQVRKVVFAPDGRTLMAASDTETAHVWEVLTGKEVRRVGKHNGWVWSVACSPTGRVVASGSVDTTAVIWDLGSVAMTSARRLVELTAAQRDDAWRDLAGPDAGRALQAALKLSAAPPGQVVPFLQDNLRPALVHRIDVARVEQLIQELDDDEFTVRERAGTELEKLGPAAGAALRKALDNPRSLEARRRLEDLVEKLEEGVIPAERLRALRALRVLEDLDTPETRQLLRKLAGGAPDDLLTREAAAVVTRLARRSPPAP